MYNLLFSSCQRRGCCPLSSLSWIGSGQRTARQDLAAGPSINRGLKTSMPFMGNPSKESVRLICLHNDGPVDICKNIPFELVMVDGGNDLVVFDADQEGGIIHQNQRVIKALCLCQAHTFFQT